MQTARIKNLLLFLLKQLAEIFSLLFLFSLHFKLVSKHHPGPSECIFCISMDLQLCSFQTLAQEDPTCISIRLKRFDISNIA